MSLGWEIKASTEIVCEDRKKVNKLFLVAREQMEGYRNRPRDARPRAFLIVNKTSQEHSLSFVFSVSLRVPLYRPRYHEPLRIGHRPGGRGRCCLLKLLEKENDRNFFSLNTYKILFWPLHSISLKTKTGFRSPRNKLSLGSQWSPTVCARKLLLFCLPSPLHGTPTLTIRGCTGEELEMTDSWREKTKLYLWECLDS